MWLGARHWLAMLPRWSHDDASTWSPVERSAANFSRIHVKAWLGIFSRRSVSPKGPFDTVECSLLLLVRRRLTYLRAATRARVAVFLLLENEHLSLSLSFFFSFVTPHRFLGHAVDRLALKLVISCLRKLRCLTSKLQKVTLAVQDGLPGSGWKGLEAV